MDKSPDSLSDTFETSGTLVSPCEGVPTVKMFPPPPPNGDEELDSDAPTVFVVPRDSTPTVKRSTPPIAPKSEPASRLAFVRGVATGIALTSVALLAVVLIVSAPASWRDLSEVRPVAMSLVERLTARRADAPPAEPTPAEKAERAFTPVPQPPVALPTARHHEPLVRHDREASHGRDVRQHHRHRAQKPAKSMLDRAL